MSQEWTRKVYRWKTVLPWHHSMFPVQELSPGALPYYDKSMKPYDGNHGPIPHYEINDQTIEYAPLPVIKASDAFQAMNAVSIEYTPPAGEGIYHILDVGFEKCGFEVWWNTEKRHFEVGVMDQRTVFGQGVAWVFKDLEEVLSYVEGALSGRISKYIDSLP